MNAIVDTTASAYTTRIGPSATRTGATASVATPRTALEAISTRSRGIRSAYVAMTGASSAAGISRSSATRPTASAPPSAKATRPMATVNAHSAVNAAPNDSSARSIAPFARMLSRTAASPRCRQQRGHRFGPGPEPVAVRWGPQHPAHAVRSAGDHRTAMDLVDAESGCRRAVRTPRMGPTPEPPVLQERRHDRDHDCPRPVRRPFLSHLMEHPQRCLTTSRRTRTSLNPRPDDFSPDAYRYVPGDRSSDLDAGVRLRLPAVRRPRRTASAGRPGSTSSRCAAAPSPDRTGS